MSASILVVGAGSIGRRHAENLRRLGADVTLVDAEIGLEVPGGHDGVVVASPTVHHAAHAASALGTGAAVFVEKPLATSVAEAEPIVAAAAGRLMVGYNLRYHEPLRRVADLLADGRVGAPEAFRLWFGQWLPDWRPHVDYRTTYSARADLGGGVLVDAIHELDLAVWFAGDALEVVGSLVTRLGPLEIDVEDTVRALLRSPAGVPVSIELDYLSRQYRRGVEVIGELANLAYDWSTRELTIRGADGTTTEAFPGPLDDAYVAEIRDFLALVTTGEHPGTNTGADGLVSLRLAESIRAAAR